MNLDNIRWMTTSSLWNSTNVSENIVNRVNCTTEPAFCCFEPSWEQLLEF